MNRSMWLDKHGADFIAQAKTMGTLDGMVKIWYVPESGEEPKGEIIITPQMARAMASALLFAVDEIERRLG